jgi:hypothetical protein
MSFTSGRVSFVRFAVVGDAPATVDNTTLATLAQHSFRETEVGAPSEVEAGFTTGEHLFDTQFTYEKNGYGAAGVLLVFALRIDTHKVPSEVKHAYKRMNESALAQGNPSGFASKSQKKEAMETAERQIHEDLASGKFRKSKTVPLLWDLTRQELYVGGASNAVVEQLARLMREAFSVQLEQLSPGALAGRFLRAMGKGRDYEDLRPSPFTRPPDAPEPEAGGDDEEAPGAVQIGSVPLVPWTQSSTDLKDFLGNEFLLWVWWQVDRGEGLIDIVNPESGKSTYAAAVVIDKSLEMECAWGVTGKQTLKSEKPTRMPEASEALACGKWPRKASLILADTGDNLQWELGLQSDKWAVSGASMPEASEAESMREVTEHRLECTRKLAALLDAVYVEFLKVRISPGWANKRGVIRKWIGSRQKAE